MVFMISNLASQNHKRTNFLFVLVDDLGYMDLGCYNSSSFYETPNIDQLASEGVRFTDGYAACPVSSPTRASILSGKYPARMATTDYFGAPQPETWSRTTPLLPATYVEELPLAEVTIAEALKEGGYLTFFAGKWHLGQEGFWPENQGFDINKGGWSRGGPYGGKGYFSPYANPRLQDGPENEHLPDRLARETINFIEKNSSQPFLAYLSFYSVHTPLMGRADLVEKYRRKKEKLGITDSFWGVEGGCKLRMSQDNEVYAAMVEAVDQAIGKVLVRLKELGIDENTVVFFMSDNGGLSTSEGHPTSNLPLRAGKGWMYEGGIRVPLIIKGTGIKNAGQLESSPVICTDFYPTILEMAGLYLKPEQHMDGVSLVPLLKDGVSLNREALFWHYPHYGNQGGCPGAVVRKGDFKLIDFFGERKPELYNLSKDVGEKNNLAESNPEKMSDLLTLLHNWQLEIGARFPSENKSYRLSSRSQ